MINGRQLLNKFNTYKTQNEKGKYLANLSDEEFKSILDLPVGFPRVYLFAMRRSFQNSNMSKYIIHIPHASLEIPRSFKNKLTMSYSKFQKENKFISDYRVDEFVPKGFSNIVKFDYSRMYCDVERYLDNKLEKMSKYGMGVLYTKDSNGKEFVEREKRDINLAIKRYKEHHEKLDNMVGRILNESGKCFIIDLHSFSDEFVSKMFDKNNNPDICLGINKSNYDIDLLEKTINHFTKHGYSVMINYPYSGSIVSNKYPNVNSIMIEINKRVYLNNSKEYKRFYNCMMEYYKLLKRY